MKTFDVAIVGGGVIGASISFELGAEKFGVVLLDSQQPGQEASWTAAGMLSPSPHSRGDLPLVPLGKESLRLYPEFVAAIEAVSGRSCGYAPEGTISILLAPQGEPERDKMVAEHRRLGLAAEPMSLEAARKWEASVGPSARAALWLPEEATVEPRLLMDAVLEAARRRGVEIRPDCRVTSLLCEDDRCIGVIAGGKKIAAKYVVVAAGCFSGGIGREPAGRSALDTGGLARYAPTYPVRGQMLALRPKSVSLRRVLRSQRGYLVPRPDGRIVAGSTLEDAGFEKCVTPAGIRQVLDAALELCPGLADAEILETWAGLRPGTPDSLPILGPTDLPGLIVATGHYRNGILLAPITAKLIREWIERGQVTFDAEAFSPSRFRDRRSQPSAPQSATATT